MLPCELWLIVFKFTDNNTFWKIINAIKIFDVNKVESLMQLICRDLVKVNHKIVLMINFLRNYEYYNLRENYLNYRYNFILDYNFKPNCLPHEYNYNKILNYRLYHDYIIDNWREFFNNDEKKKHVFMNQTRELDKKYFNIKSVNRMLYYDIEIPVSDVVKYTHSFEITYNRF